MALLKLLFLLLVQPIAGRLPHGFLMRLAELAGFVLLHGQSAKIMQKEVSRMLGPEVSTEEVRAIVLEGLQNNQKDLFEIWSFPSLNKKKVEQLTWFNTEEPLRTAFELGNGTLVGVTHFGSWKIIIAALGYREYPTYQIGIDPLIFCDPSKQRYQNKIMEIERHCEDSLPIQFLYVNKFLRGLYKAFKGNAFILNSLDGLMRNEQVDMQLGGTIVPVDKSAVSLAYRFKAPIVPIFALRQKDNRHKLVVHEPILFDPDLNKEEAVDKAFKQFLDLFTMHVFEHPSHYVRILYQLAKDGYWEDRP